MTSRHKNKMTIEIKNGSGENIVGSTYSSLPSPRINGLSIKQIFETLLTQNIIETSKKCEEGMTPQEIFNQSESQIKESVNRYTNSLKQVRQSLTETYWKSFEIMKYSKYVVFYIQFNDMYPLAFTLARKLTGVKEDSIMEIEVFKSEDQKVKTAKIEEIHKFLEIAVDLCKLTPKTLKIMSSLN